MPEEVRVEHQHAADPADDAQDMENDEDGLRSHGFDLASLICGRVPFRDARSRCEASGSLFAGQQLRE
jgi:hypothetical protein